jgi:nucleotide-binding universal stress UspA family protein
MKRILFPTDFSEAATNAFGHALAFAKKFKVNFFITFLPVLPIDEQFSQRILRWSMTRLS